MKLPELNEGRSRAASLRAAREVNRDGVLAAYPKLSLTSIAQYHTLGMPEKDAEVGALVDAGKEPYLVMLDALEMGTEPFVTVYDVMIDRPAVGTGKPYQRGDEYVAVDLHSGIAIFPPDTLIAWR